MLKPRKKMGGGGTPGAEFKPLSCDDEAIKAISVVVASNRKKMGGGGTPGAEFKPLSCDDEAIQAIPVVV